MRGPVTIGFTGPGWALDAPVLQKFEFAGIVIFKRKNICEISNENYVLCSFKLENDLIFRICATLGFESYVRYIRKFSK